MTSKIVLGLIENVKLTGKKASQTYPARIDTGATNSALDKSVAKDLDFGSIKKTKLVRSSHGTKIRPVVAVKLEIAGKQIECEFTVADRRHMKYRILIGQNVLKHGFLIDPQKNTKQTK